MRATIASIVRGAVRPCSGTPASLATGLLWRSAASAARPAVRSTVTPSTLLSPASSRPLSTAGATLNVQIRRAFAQARSITTAVPQAAAEAVSKTVPKVTDRKVGYWLLVSSGLVFGIVIVGGLTRLTESGLSITEWKPVTGSIPPLTQADWEEEFAKYQQSPEFKLLNSKMTLDEFKQIFFMEWAHRLWGRVIGLAFVLPGLYFVARGRTTSRVTWRISVIAGMIGLQGFIGWWMVKSGLDDQFLTDEKDNHPRVSPYRLVTHLGMAFVVYLSMLWTGLEVLKENRAVRDPATALKTSQLLSNPLLRKYKFLAVGLLGMVFTTAMSGAFVAGLDAGMLYNSFPYMGDSIIPPTKELMSPFYARKDDLSDLVTRNLFENPVTVQLVHRIFAVSTFTAVCLFHLYSRSLARGTRNSVTAGLLPRSVARASSGVIGFASLQVTLGICTLLYIVPTPLAAAHQAGSLALLTEVLILCMRLRKPRPELVQYLQKLAKGQ
ncbi:cytochrome oxidase assembly protein-domain-containing protein [Dipodascopsis tothii]|uniref:cytochrome oxidase assembly protein-domain-containing protein n=1 Tax=Dipodascopsis tothii TaxID=44089 RepID=UPI0034CE6C1D